MEAPAVAYSLAILFALYAGVTRERMKRIKDALPDNIKQIYLGDEK